MMARFRLAILSVLALAVTADAQPDSTRASAPVVPTAHARPDSTRSSAPAAPTANPDSVTARGAGAAAPKAPAETRVGRTVPARSQRSYRFDAVTLGVRHRVFHDFRDLHRVKLSEEFVLGDGDYRARVVQYLPDFQMDLGTRRYFSLSDQPNTPAFRIIVRKGKIPQDTTWAFLNNPPHFSARSYFAFQVLKVELPGRPPLLPDTTSRLFKPGGHAPGAPPAPSRPDSTRKP